MRAEIDYRAVFRRQPGAMAILGLDHVILDASEDWLEVTGRDLGDVVGRDIFLAFPARPGDPGDTGPADLRASLEAVVATGERDVMHVTRYDVEDRGRPGVFEERYWAIVNAPIHGDDGKVAMIAHWGLEVTHVVREALAPRV